MSERPTIEGSSDFQPKATSLETRARATRLKAAVKAGGGNKVVSLRSEVAPSTLSSYIAGREMNLAAMVALADACGVSIEWLATGRGAMNSAWITSRSPGAAPLGEQPDGTHVSAMEHLGTDAVAFRSVSDSAPSGYVTVPRYNIAASAGNGSLVDHEQVVEYLAFNERFLRDVIRRPREHLLIVEARGSSMEPGIRDGDALLVDISPDQGLDSGGLYVLRVGESLLVKRVEVRVTGAVVLHSDNPRYAPETVEPDALEQLHIVGRVIWAGGPPRS